MNSLKLLLNKRAPDDIRITYHNHKSNAHWEITNDKLVKPCQVLEKPDIQINSNKDVYYTLLLVDPDVPPGALQAAFIHWMVINIKNDNVRNGVEILPYIGAGPPKGTGIHRYFFLLFKQDNFYKPDEIMKVKNNHRNKNQLQIFFQNNIFQENNLIAKIHFRAEYDDCVPNVHKRVRTGPPSN